MILIGTGLIAICYVLFGAIAHSLWIYYAIWFFFVAGYIFSGPIPHQIIISNWYKEQRGFAMGITYVGVAIVGAMANKVGPALVFFGIALFMVLFTDIRLSIALLTAVASSTVRNATRPASSSRLNLRRTSCRCLPVSCRKYMSHEAGRSSTMVASTNWQSTAYCRSVAAGTS